MTTFKYRGTLVFNNMVQFLRYDGTAEEVDVEITVSPEYPGKTDHTDDEYEEADRLIDEARDDR